MGGEGVDVTFWFLIFGLRSLKIDCIFWMQKGYGTFFVLFCFFFCVCFFCGGGGGEVGGS